MLHAPLFTLAKQFKKLCFSDQKILFQFVDTFLPPNHGLYFLLREILQTGSKTAKAITIDDGIDDGQLPLANPEKQSDIILCSVRDYSGCLSLSAYHAPPRLEKKRGHDHYTSTSDSASSDDLSDTTHANRRKNPGKITVSGDAEAYPLTTKKRNIYRLLNSTSTNAVERHYDRALQEELRYWHDCQTAIAADKASPSHLQLIHCVMGIHSNNMHGNTAHTARYWHGRADQRIRRHIHYAIHYPEIRDEKEEASIHPPDAYTITLRLMVNWHPSDDVMASINYLQENVARRADRLSRFIRHYARKLDELPGSTRPPTPPVERQKDRRADERPYSEKSQHHDNKTDELPLRQSATAARRFGVMHLLPSEVRKKNRHLYSFDQLQQLTDYVVAAASTKTIKLIDFALLSAEDTWALLNQIMDHALDIYRDYHRYPVQDTLTSILLHDTEKTEKLIHCEGERLLSIHRYALIWPNGDNAKLGDVITFVQSYRRLIRTVLSTCCCYVMNRRAANTRSFIEKHPCLLPKATQGIYFSLFLRMRAGHELLCLSQVNTASEAYGWLQKFERLRETLWRKRQIPYSNRLHDHLTSLSPTLRYQNSDEDNPSAAQAPKRPAATTPPPDSRSGTGESDDYTDNEEDY